MVPVPKAFPITTVVDVLRSFSSASVRERLLEGSFRLMFVLAVKGCNVITPDPDCTCTAWTIFMSSAVRVIAPFPADVLIPSIESTEVMLRGGENRLFGYKTGL